MQIDYPFASSEHDLLDQAADLGRFLADSMVNLADAVDLSKDGTHGLIVALELQQAMIRAAAAKFAQRDTLRAVAS